MPYKNPEKEKAYQIARYRANAEKIKQKSARWKKENPEKQTIYRKKWAANNPMMDLFWSAKSNNRGLPKELLAVIVMKNMIRKEIRNQTNQTT